MAKDKLSKYDPVIIASIIDGIKGRKDPKGKAKPTQVHRDKTTYKRKPKHVRDTQDGQE